MQVSIKIAESHRQVLDHLIARAIGRRTSTTVEASMVSILLDVHPRFELGHFQLPKHSYTRKLKYHEGVTIMTLLSASDVELKPYESILMQEVLNQLDKQVNDPRYLTNIHAYHK